MMPHKRNPDVFELTRARAAAVEGDLATVMQLKGRLTSGYHRDFQLLKEPLLRGLLRTREMLGMMTLAVSKLTVDKARCAQAVSGGVLATDEVMRRVETGIPFRTAYREVAAELKQGIEPSAPAQLSQLVKRRLSTGGAGNLGLAQLRRQLKGTQRVAQQKQRIFAGAMAALAGESSTEVLV
jgi:argininosuccinate lyase